MPGVLSSYIGRIKGRLVSATVGLVESAQVFDFDSVPASIMDKNYRLVTKAAQQILQEKMSALYRTEPDVEIFIALKFPAKGSRTAKYMAAVDLNEVIESELVAEFPPGTQPIFELKGFETSEYKDNYLIILFRCHLTYWPTI